MKKVLLSMVAIAATVFTANAVEKTEKFDISAADVKEVWEPADNGLTAIKDGETFKVTIGAAYGDNEWANQVKINGGVTYDPSKFYDVSFKIVATENVGAAKFKLDDAAEIIYDPNINLEANTEKVISYKNKVGANNANSVIFFGFPYAPAGTVITISEISILEKDEEEEDALPELIEGAERFHAENVTIIETKTFIDENGDWSGQNPNGSEVKWEDGVLTFDSKADFAGQWHAQVFLNTNITFNAESKYQFTCKLKSNVAASGITIKLQDKADMFTNVCSLKADTEKTIILQDLTTTSTENELIFDFGGLKNGTTVQVYDISIVEQGVEDNGEDNGEGEGEGETALHTTKANIKAAKKIVENGQVVILRDGKRFNILGSEIK